MVANERDVKLSKWWTSERLNVLRLSMLKSGNSTKYFKLILNGKHQNKNIVQLKQDEGSNFEEANLEVCVF
jgi:hypothetical protein